MNSSSDRIISSQSLIQPKSFDLRNILFDGGKIKQKNTKGIYMNNKLYNYQLRKEDFKFLEKYVHKYFITFYKNSKNDFNIRMIDDILNNESTHLVAEFKDYLIMGDITEFLQKSYSMKEVKKYLPKIYDYYNSCSVIFPNYVVLHESKYIYKSIRKKQKVIDNQQEQEDKKEKLKKGDIKIEDNEEFFGSKTFYSILDQTNTSNVKIFFGLDENNNIDADETPNNIVTKLEQAENEKKKKKINLIKNKNKPIFNTDTNVNTNNNLNEDDTSNNVNSINSNNNSKLLTNNNKSKSKIYLKNIIKQRNNTNFHNFSSHKKSLKINLNNRIIINNYLTKIPFSNGNNSQKNIKSCTINDTENENKILKDYITFYDNNKITKKNDTKKLFIGNNINKPYQVYMGNGNHSNKNIKKQYINSLFPTKTIVSKIFYNLNNNSTLKHNSFNFINQKMMNKNYKEENNYFNGPIFPMSPSSNTIQTNPFKKNFNYNLNINIKESNSTQNIINHKLSGSTLSNEKLQLKNIPKMKRNQNFINYNSNTITAYTSKTTKKKDGIQYMKTNINSHNNNKIKISNIYSNINNLNNFPKFNTIASSSKSNTNIKNNNINKNEQYINNFMINDINFHKINSTSNIKKPINMNININMNNNGRNGIYFNDGLSDNMQGDKIISKSPLNIELETINVTKRKRTIYPKTKALSNMHNRNKNMIINNNFNGNIINTINNNIISNDKNYFVDSLAHSSLNSNNQIEENVNNGVKSGLILEEINKKKNIILPFDKEINSINININGYNPHVGSLTSRESNKSKKGAKYRGNNGQDLNYYNQEFKTKVKGKNIKMNKNEIISRNENNPVKIKRLFDNIKNSRNFENMKKNEYFTSQNK